MISYNCTYLIQQLKIQERKEEIFLLRQEKRLKAVRAQDYMKSHLHDDSRHTAWLPWLGH